MNGLKISLSSLIRFSIIGYVIFGFGVSAVPVIKKLSFVFTVVGLVFLVCYLVKYNRTVPSYMKWLSVFFIYLVISAMWAPVFDFLAVRALLATFIASSVVVLAMQYNIVKIEWLIIVLALPALINAVAYILGVNYYFVGHGGIDASRELAMERFGGLTGHPNNLAIRCLLPLMVFSVFFKELDKNKSLVFILIVVMACACFSIISTGSKKSVVLMLLSFSLLMVNVKSGRLIVPLVTVFVLIFGSYMSIFAVDMLLESDVNALSRIGQMLEGTDHSTSEREYMARIAPVIFMDYPLLGAGYNGFSYLSGIGAYAHNNHLELAASSGVVGLVLYYSLFIIMLVGFFKKNGMVMVLYALAVFLFMDFTGVIYMERASLLYLFVFAYCSFNKKKLLVGYADKS